jgi:hypothetical protein
VPVADAMVLHGVTMIAANGWRGILWRRYILWGVLARYVLGLVVAGAMFASLMIVPDERVIFLVLGVVCFLGLILPERLVPQADRRFGAELCGFLCTVFQLLSGVSGPVFDVFFVRTRLDRRVVVATKSACQLVTHLAKTVYFGALVGGVSGIGTAPTAIVIAIAMAIAGTSLARPLLDRMSDGAFRSWTARILMAVGALYVWRGIAGFM